MNLLIDSCVTKYNAYIVYHILRRSEDIGGHALIRCREGCRDHLRRQGDHGAHFAR